MSLEGHPLSGSPELTMAYANASCLDFLLIELVPMAYRIAAELAAREDEYLAGPSAPGVGNAAAGGGKTRARAGSGAGGSTIAGGASASGSTVDDDETREAVFFKLEMLGYRVGLGIVERCVLLFVRGSVRGSRVSVGMPLFLNPRSISPQYSPIPI